MKHIDVTLVSEESIGLDGVSGWIGLFEFTFPASAKPIDGPVLAGLLRHDRYRDDYIGPPASHDRTTARPHDRTTEQTHGPYDLSRLIWSHFAKVREDPAIREIAVLLLRVHLLRVSVYLTLVEADIRTWLRVKRLPVAWETSMTGRIAATTELSSPARSGPGLSILLILLAGVAGALMFVVRAD